jgi:hypothetical protein
MHGYHPSEKQSYAALCTNQEKVPDEVAAIPDIFRLMTRDAELANERNSQGKRPKSAASKEDRPLERPVEVQRPVEA